MYFHHNTLVHLLLKIEAFQSSWLLANTSEVSFVFVLFLFLVYVSKFLWDWMWKSIVYFFLRKKPICRARASMIKMAQIALKVGNINKRFSVPILISLLIKASNKSLHFNFYPHNFDFFFFLYFFVCLCLSGSIILEYVS